MSKVFVALAVSADGYITGRDPGAGRGLGDGTMLFDWYFDGDTPSQVFDGFKKNVPPASIEGAIQVGSQRGLHGPQSASFDWRGGRHARCHR